MANTADFTGNENIFDKIRFVRNEDGNIVAETFTPEYWIEQIRLINASPLLKDLLWEFAKTGKEIIPSGNINKYVPIYSGNPESGNIYLSNFTSDAYSASNFVRLLSRELFHFANDMAGTSPCPSKYFNEAIKREMDEAEATANRFLIRMEILIKTGEDIGVSSCPD